MRPLDSTLRRSLDLLASAVGLVLLAPIIIAISLAIKALDRGPVLYRATRIGKDKQPFRLYKFRTMIVDADRRGPAITAQGDARVTPIGRWLRRTKLDELPQILNVLRGEMSLVGPRPEDPRYVALYDQRQQQVLNVRPGITSAASLAYRHEERILAGHDWETVYREQIMPAKLAIDLDYITRRNIMKDLLLILRTIRAIFT
ncbi:MAG: sugar transferase [Chloroflexales bacterium]|nr:sugar transferase [Chloroflexales bacterium]